MSISKTNNIIKKNNFFNNKNKSYYVYGKHSALSLLNNPKRKIQEIICTKEFFIKNDIIKTQIFSIKSKSDIEKIIGDNHKHQGIIIKTLPITNYNLNDINLNKKKSLIVILDNLKDPTNIGTIIRNAVAFGADAIITTINNSPSENTSMAVSSSGAIEKINFIAVHNLVNTIKILKKHNYWITGFDSNTENIISKKSLENKTAIIMGSEEKGMRELTKKNCDFLYKIPIENISSLNVASASAIAFYLYTLKN